jgi:hypothetical protein
MIPPFFEHAPFLRVRQGGRAFPISAFKGQLRKSGNAGNAGRLNRDNVRASRPGKPKNVLRHCSPLPSRTPFLPPSQQAPGQSHTSHSDHVSDVTVRRDGSLWAEAAPGNVRRNHDHLPSILLTAQASSLDNDGPATNRFIRFLRAGLSAHNRRGTAETRGRCAEFCWRYVVMVRI